MPGKSTLRTGNDGIQFDFHIYSSPLNALSKMDGIHQPPPASPHGGRCPAEGGTVGVSSRSALTFACREAVDLAPTEFPNLLHCKFIRSKMLRVFFLEEANFLSSTPTRLKPASRSSLVP